MRRLFDRPLFTIEESRYSWGDAVLLGMLTGAWKTLEEEVRRGLACQALAREAGDAEPDLAIEEFSAAFRYARGLLTADETTAWLARRAIDPAEWVDWTIREVLRGGWAQNPERLHTAAVPTEAVANATWVHLACSEAGHKLAEALATRAAIGDRPGEDGNGPAAIDRAGVAARASHIAALQDAWSRYRAQPLAEEQLQRELELGRVEWVRVECRFVTFATVPAAREARLCVIEDGLTLETVAREAKTPVRELRRYLRSMGPEVRTSLLAAVPGEWVGPLVHEGWPALFLLEKKTLAEPDDPDLRHALARSARARREREQVMRRVRWHEPWPEGQV